MAMTGAETYPESKQPPKRNRRPPDRLGRSVASATDDPDYDEQDDEASEPEPITAMRRNPTRGLQPFGVSKEPMFSNYDSLPESSRNFVQALEKNQRTELNTIAKFLRASKREIKTSKDKVHDLKLQIESLQKYQHDRLEEIQTRALRHMEHSSAKFKMDNDIQALFQEGMRRMKSFVKEYGIEGAATSLGEASRSEITSYLTTGRHSASSSNCIKQAFKQNVAATTVLNAMLSKALSGNLLSRPSFFLNEVLDETSKSHRNDAFDSIYNLCLQVDPDKAKVWKSQTFALLQTRVSPMMDESSAQSRIQASKLKAYARVTESFLSSSAVEKLLKPLHTKEDQKRRARALLDIVTDIGDYVVELATQKADMKIASFADVRAEGFVNGSTRIRPHPSLLLDVGDKSSDGNKILLLVEPLILAYGNEEGRNYDVSETWHPAVVIVVLPADHQLAQALPPHPDRKGSNTSLQSGHHESADEKTAQNCSVEEALVSHGRGSPLSRSTRSRQSDEQTRRTGVKRKASPLSNNGRRKTSEPQKDGTFSSIIEQMPVDIPSLPNKNATPSFEPGDDGKAESGPSHATTRLDTQNDTHETPKEDGSADTPINLEDDNDVGQGNTITTHQGEQQAS